LGSGDGKVIGLVKMVDNGPATERFNVVIVAEGYQQGEMAKFAGDAQRFVNRLFTHKPFDQLWRALNIYRLDVTSTDSGADDPVACGGNGKTAATYFDASFCNGGIRRLLLVNTGAVLKVVNAEIPQWHLVLVIVNSSIWGGGGGSIATTSTASGWEDVAIHEMGHSAFGLADEYEYYQGCGIDKGHDRYSGAEPVAPNITTKSDRTTIKWRGLILSSTLMPTTSNADCTLCDPQHSPALAGTVGAFEGAGYYHCGIHRPEFNCMMRNLANFCAVCQQRIRETLAPFALKRALGGVDGQDIGRRPLTDAPEVRNVNLGKNPVMRIDCHIAETLSK